MTRKECMDLAKNYMERLTICSDRNVPSKVVADHRYFFTWDNELRTPLLKPYLFDWSYYNGVVMEGLLDIYDALEDKEQRNLLNAAGDGAKQAGIEGNTKECGQAKDGEAGECVTYARERFLSYVKEYLDAMIGTDESGHPILIRDKAGYVDHHGVDCYKTAVILERMTDGKDTYAAIAADLYRDVTDEGYANSRGDIVAWKYTEEALGGNYWHGWAGGSDHPPMYKVWLDGIYMLQPFITAHAVRIGDRAQLQKVVKRFAWVAEEMYAPNGLYYHACNSRGDVCNFHWTRAIGWYGMAMVDVAELLPEDMRAGIRDAVRKFVDGMLPYQHESGMWANLADRPVTATNRLETSGTAMMAYIILKAIRLGLLDAPYQDKAVKAFCGIVEEKLVDDSLKDIYMKASADGTNNYENTDYYMPDEGKGSGPFLMAYAEMLRL